ncbi:MAG: TonB-dependent receptor [Gemmatimonadota bacterium]
MASQATAQSQGWIEGRVAAADGRPIADAMVTADGLDRETTTGRAGRFVLGPLTPGRYRVRASALGYGDGLSVVVVSAGDTARAEFALETEALRLSGIAVSVLRPTLQPQLELGAGRARESNPRDAGDLLRGLPGLSAVRRGALGLDPVVRGLRETEVGVYLDGTRQFPAGPARMDSPLSHLDPTTLENIEVVKGPYALTWGAGNASAIRVRTQPLPPATPGLAHGRILTGYDANLDAKETSASLLGSSGPLSYWGSGAWREGSTYTNGSGDDVPAGYRSWETRGKVGYATGPRSNLVFSGGYQRQEDIDYPGLILDANYFRTLNAAAEWRVDRSRGSLRNLNVLAYVNDVNHAMDNDDKPTAQPNPDRIPPFPLDVAVDAGIRVYGGRLAATLFSGPAWELEVGGDVYHTLRQATRTIHRRDTGMLMFTDLMWPDAAITDGGVFARATHTLGSGVSLAATARLDAVRARADSVSDFFTENVASGSGLDADEANLSGALTVSWQAARAWFVALGVGSVVRTADATERYSDRIPASKAQTSAEFVGDPSLAPERSTQADVWVDGRFSRASVSFNLFGRRIDDFITLEPTNLPKRLPLSPPTVYRYINGEARFWGVEGTLTVALSDEWTLMTRASHLRGSDRTLDEPALGIPPLHGTASLRWQPSGGRAYVETIAHASDRQDRVATTRGEEPTAGYGTFDVHAGLGLVEGAMLRVGVDNLADRWYVNALNARNPFTGAPIAEPGRVVFARVSWAF